MNFNEWRDSKMEAFHIKDGVKLYNRLSKSIAACEVATLLDT